MSARSYVQAAISSGAAGVARSRHRRYDGINDSTRAQRWAARHRAASRWRGMWRRWRRSAGDGASSNGAVAAVAQRYRRSSAIIGAARA